MLLCGAALSQLSWGERLQSADGTWRACLARSQRAGGGTRCPRAALLSASSAGESYCRARTTRGVLVSRDLNASVAAFVAALLFCPPPVRLGRATAERGRHMACSSQAIATRRLRRLMLPSGAALRHLGLGERLQCADGTCRAPSPLVFFSYSCEVFLVFLLACLPSPSSSPSPPLSESPTPTWPSVKSSLSPTPSQCRQSAARAGSGRSRRRNTDELPSAGSSGEAVLLSSIPGALPVLLGVGLAQSGAHHTPSNAPNTLRLEDFWA